MERPTILTANNAESVKKLKKPILTARIITFCLAGISLLFAILGLYIGPAEGKDEIAAIIIDLFEVVAILYLVFGIVSIWKAFVCIMFSSVISFSVFCGISYGLFVHDKSYYSIETWCIVVAFLSVIGLQLRGALYAKKLEKL
jgi:hypothetical protein